MCLTMVFVKLTMRMHGILCSPLFSYLDESKDGHSNVVPSPILALRRCNIVEDQLLTNIPALSKPGLLMTSQFCSHVVLQNCDSPNKRQPKHF